MWFFMISCYIFSVLTLFLLLINGLQGHFNFNIFHANHAAFAILTIISYLFTQTLIIFYFVGIGVSIKEFMLQEKISGDFHKKLIHIKRILYPPVLLNILFVMILFISGGAVDTHKLPGTAHGLLFLVCLVHFGKVLCLEHTAFKESTETVIAMAHHADILLKQP